MLEFCEVRRESQQVIVAMSLFLGNQLCGLRLPNAVCSADPSKTRCIVALPEAQLAECIFSMVLRIFLDIQFFFSKIRKYNKK
jgi:hypothetical protein